MAMIWRFLLSKVIDMCVGMKYNKHKKKDKNMKGTSYEGD